MIKDNYEERYEAFIRNSSEGIWLCELKAPIPTSLPLKKQIDHIFKDAYMADANEAMARMYSVPSPQDLVGMPLNQIMVEGDPQNVAYLTAFIKSGYRLTGVDSHERDAEGNNKIFRNSLVGVVENGKLLRAWGTQVDITERYLSDEALHKSEERLALALKVSGLGIWEWDFLTDKLTWTDQLKALFGLAPEEEITYKKYLSLIHPEDRKYSRDIIKKASKTGNDYRVEHRVVWPDGSIHWIMGQGKAIFQNKKSVSMIGTSMSIDDTKRKDELEKINKRLKYQQIQLEKLNEVKDDFISLASHQLRTPVTAVKQYLLMLLEGYYGKLQAEQRRALEVAYESNERQLTTINDLLKIAQIDAGKMILKKSEIDMYTLLKNIIKEQDVSFKSKKQNVKLEGDGPLLIKVDPERIRMVFENILDNAHKYTPKHKSITIDIKKDEKYLSISIADQGIGIAKNNISKLFEKFSRINHPLTREISGSGLGLYWANKVVKLHKGSIELTSSPGKGSVFTVRLPF